MNFFDDAVTKTLQFEGGYSDDPHDKGRETKYGISKAAFPNLDIKAITIAQAKGIYKHRYWDRLGLEQLERRELAIKVFDLCVQTWDDPIKWLQQSANDLGAQLKVDGVLGPITARTVNSYPHPLALLALVKHYAAAHYKAQNQPRFLAGWLNRLEA